MSEIKETRAEKNRRLKAEREAEELREKRERLERNPLRLLKLLARAASYENDGVSFRIHDGATGEELTKASLLRVVFMIQHSGGCYNSEDVLYLMSEEWEFESVESLLDQIDEKKREAERKLALAREAYDLLTEEQRKALNLTHRP